MAFDIHPILVHFPIALLTVYALLECLRFRRLLAQSWLVPTKAVLLILGELGTFAALASGDAAKQAYRNTTTRTLVNVHSNYAVATTWLFGMLALLYIVFLLDKHYPVFKKNRFFGWRTRFASFVLNTWFIIVPLALLGLALVTITGALGGAIVYGSNADPIVNYVTTLLGVA